MKKVEGYENYLIREDGALFRERDMYQLTVRKRRKDYLYYELSNMGQQKHCSVHGLVAKYFCEGYMDGLQINHKDGNKANNHYSNLEWITMEENLAHAYQNDLIHLAKLSKEDVQEILFEANILVEKFSEKFNVQKATIRRALEKPGMMYRISRNR